MAYDFLIWVLGLCADCVCPALWCTFFSLDPETQTLRRPGKGLESTLGTQHGLCAMAEVWKDRLGLSVELVRGSHRDLISSTASSSVT